MHISAIYVLYHVNIQVVRNCKKTCQKLIFCHIFYPSVALLELPWENAFFSALERPFCLLKDSWKTRHPNISNGTFTLAFGAQEGIQKCLEDDATLFPVGIALFPRGKFFDFIQSNRFLSYAPMSSTHIVYDFTAETTSPTDWDL